MRVLSSAYGLRGVVEPMPILAVRLRAPGAEFDTAAVAAEESDAPVASGVMPKGLWL